VRAGTRTIRRWVHHEARYESGELAIFEPSEQSIDLVAEGNTRFVLGSAAKHPHDLTLGNYSLHTSMEALRTGEQEIRRIGQRLVAEGKRSYALGEYGNARASRSLPRADR
jgi:hypothetical protein